MGLFDQLLGAAAGQLGGAGMAAAPAGTDYNAGSVGQTPDPQTALSGIVDLLHSPQVGGVGGLMQLFEQHGLGHIAQGWVNQGANPPVSSNQLMQVLGPAVIGQFAQRMGVGHEQAGGLLARLLPHVVDHMTPNGQIPSQPATPQNAGGVFDMLKGTLLGG